MVPRSTPDGLLGPVDSETVHLVLECAYAFLELGRPEAAKEVFQGVALLAPALGWPWLGLAWVAEVQGNPREALRLLRHAEKLGPANESVLASVLLGELLLRLAKPHEALRAFSRAEAGAPHQPLGRWARLRLKSQRGT